MTEPIKTAVIGVGVGKAHIRGYQATPGCELFAICDTDSMRMREVGAQYNIPAERQFTSVDDLLKMDEIQAVSVTLPNHLHAPISIAALQAGKHVLCEKPLARSATEAQTMVDAARAAGKLLMVCFNYRFREDSRWLKSLQSQGEMGNIYFAKAGWLRNIGIPGFGGWFTRKEMAGGGPLIDLGVHILDLSLWLMDYPQPVSVSGVTFAEFGPRGKKAWGKRPDNPVFDVEDLATGFVRFSNGSALSLETSWASHTKSGRDDFFVTLYGSEGGAELYVANYTDRDTVRFFTEEGGLPVDINPNMKLNANGHQLAIAHFLDCITTGKESDAPGEHGVTLLRIIDALYESARIGREIRLDS